MQTAPPTVPVFDVGGVLIDWDPRHLYRDLIPDEAARERFLAEVCTPAWNRQMDLGKPFAEAVAELAARHPDQADLIAAYDAQWMRMVPQALDDTVAVLEELAAAGRRICAITNFSAEKFAQCQARFGFLRRFQTVTVSGAVGLAKPDPAIFRRFLADAGLKAEDCLFIDDMPANVEAALALGMRAIRFVDAAGLRDALAAHGLLPACG